MCVDGCLERELSCQHLNERLDFVAGNNQVLQDMAGWAIAADQN
jgi:hypothetical protein